jgi:hypothetical protein
VKNEEIDYIIGSIFICWFLLDYYIHVKNDNTIETTYGNEITVQITKDSIDNRIDESWQKYGK